MEENNEEVVVNDVPETSEKSENAEETLDEVVVNASQDETSQDTVVETNPEEDMEKRIEEEVNKRFEEKISARIARDRASQERKYNKELAKYKQLENIINAGLGVNNIDDAISRTSNFYKEQGIDIPEFQDTFSERDQKVLARADAQEIIDLGKEEMESEANRLSNIPLDKMTVRERTMFDTICAELSNLKNIDELKTKGYDTEILKTKEFQDFRNQFNFKTPISTIYEMYNKFYGKEVKQPSSPGSAKTSTTDNVIKEYYTPEEARKFTEEDFDRNPKLYEAVEKSMLQWNKSN
jgi:hypothetical protein